MFIESVPFEKAGRNIAFIKKAHKSISPQRKSNLNYRWNELTNKFRTDYRFARSYYLNKFIFCNFEKSTQLLPAVKLPKNNHIKPHKTFQQFSKFKLSDKES